MSLEEPEPAPTETPVEEASVTDAPVTDAPVDNAPVAEEPVAPAPNRGLKLAVVMLAALSFGLAVLAAVLTTQDDGAEGDAAVRRTAGAFATAFVSFDTDDTDAWRSGVLRLSAGSFKKDFERSGKALADLYEASGTSLEPLDVEVFLGEVDGDTATAFTIAEVASTGPSRRAEILNSFLRLDLVRVDDRWLVDGVSNYNLPAGRGAGSGTAPPATTSTTGAARR